MDKITGDATFVPAVNIPGYDIGTIDNEMAISFPGSDYAGELTGLKLFLETFSSFLSSLWWDSEGLHQWRAGQVVFMLRKASLGSSEPWHAIMW